MKYIYKILPGIEIKPRAVTSTTGIIEEKENFLNKLGEEGWELIGVYYNFAYFKKLQDPIEQKESE